MDKIILKEGTRNISKDWFIVDNKLQRNFVFADFQQTLEAVNKISKLAEEVCHHPEIYFTFDELTVSINTHSMNAITNLDFDLASRIDSLNL